MKKLAFLGGAIGLGVGALLIAHTSHAADHLDAPGVGGPLAGGTGAQQPMADINDVYAWMTSDHSKVNLAMTISPGDDGTRNFGPSVLYAFHVTAVPSYGMTGTETDVICQFASDTSAQCWVQKGNTTLDYITGDPSSTVGLVNADQKITLFAGRRSDPFFFNLQGFRDATHFVATNGGGLGHDAAGCPTTGTAAGNAGIGNVLRTCLGVGGATAAFDPNGGAAHTAVCTGAPGTAAAPCATDSFDCFAHLNVLAIVLQVDAKLLSSATNPVIGVWASTHAAM